MKIYVSFLLIFLTLIIILSTYCGDSSAPSKDTTTTCSCGIFSWKVSVFSSESSPIRYNAKIGYSTPMYSKDVIIAVVTGEFGDTSSIDYSTSVNQTLYTETTMSKVHSITLDLHGVGVTPNYKIDHLSVLSQISNECYCSTKETLPTYH